MNVALCMIVRDGVETLEECLASIRPYVNEVNIYDTGSTDGTLDLLKRLAEAPGRPLRVERGEWRDDFAWAREQSFAMASRDCNWLMWLDADDVVRGGANIGRVVKQTVAKGYPCVMALYDAYDGIDFNAQSYFRERIVRRGSGFWEGVVHEHYRMSVPFSRLRTVPPELFHIRHQKRVQEEQAGKYLALLESAAEDIARTPRALYNLGNEYAALQRHEDAGRAWLRYVREAYSSIEAGTGFRERALDLVAEAAKRLGGEGGAALEAERELLLAAPVPAPKPKEAQSRNSLCECGSGKKFKKCHGA